MDVGHLTAVYIDRTLRVGYSSVRFMYQHLPDSVVVFRFFTAVDVEYKLVWPFFSAVGPSAGWSGRRDVVARLLVLQLAHRFFCKKKNIVEIQCQILSRYCTVKCNES